HLLLTMPEIRRQQMFTTALYGQRAAAAVIALGLLGVSGSALLDINNLDTEISDKAQQKATKEKQIEMLKRKSTHTPEELDRIVRSVGLYNDLGKLSYRPDSLLIRLSQALAQSDRAVEFSWQLHDLKAPGAKPAMRLPSPVAEQKPKDPNAV